MRSMFGCLPTATIFGVRMQAAQSRVGKVLSNIAMWPPMVARRSTRWTLCPASAISSDAWIPATPAPITSVSALTFAVPGSAASPNGTPRTAQATTAFARSRAWPSRAPSAVQCSRNEARRIRPGSPPACASARANAALKNPGESPPTMISSRRSPRICYGERLGIERLRRGHHADHAHPGQLDRVVGHGLQVQRASAQSPRPQRYTPIRRPALMDCSSWFIDDSRAARTPAASA